jgi:hypothetical protein
VRDDCDYFDQHHHPGFGPVVPVAASFHDPNDRSKSSFLGNTGHLCARHDRRSFDSGKDWPASLLL